MLPKEKIAKKLQFMKKSIDFLRDYDKLSLIELKENSLLRYAIERNFHLAIETSLDIGELLISEENFEKPEDYESVLLILGKHNVLPMDFAEKFAPMAGFRNILVHMYVDIDLKILQKYLREKLTYFDTFARYIAKYIEKRKY